MPPGITSLDGEGADIMKLKLSSIGYFILFFFVHAAKSSMPSPVSAAYALFDLLFVSLVKPPGTQSSCHVLHAFDYEFGMDVSGSGGACVLSIVCRTLTQNGDPGSPSSSNVVSTTAVVLTRLPSSRRFGCGRTPRHYHRLVQGSLQESLRILLNLRRGLSVPELFRFDANIIYLLLWRTRKFESTVRNPSVITGKGSHRSGRTLEL